MIRVCKTKTERPETEGKFLNRPGLPGPEQLAPTQIISRSLAPTPPGDVLSEEGNLISFDLHPEEKLSRIVEQKNN